MKKVTLTMLVILSALILQAQAPQSVKYQAVARNSNGEILSNQNVSFRISILKESPMGLVVYMETHSNITNQFGLVSLEIGKGDVSLGIFEDINWREGSFFIQTEMDESGGGNYQVIGTTQLLTVPYSFYSELSGGMVLTDENGVSYTISVDTLGNLVTTFLPEFSCGDSLFDWRDGQKYGIVQIFNQCWMAENLNIGIQINGNSEQLDNSEIEKYCYDDMDNNCDVYGGLYQWDEMMEYSIFPGAQGICPAGWHVPTDNEWCILEYKVDPTSNCDMGWNGTDGGTKLKSGGSAGFNALLAGRRRDGGPFTDMGSRAYFYTSTQYDPTDALGRRLELPNPGVNRFNDEKVSGFSVRCLMDEPFNSPPETPSSPTPTNGAIDININSTLSWICTDTDYDLLTFDVYFGEGGPLFLVSSGQTEDFFDLGLLNYSTTYYWKIIAYDDHSNFTKGQVWSFTTSANLAPNSPESPSPADGSIDIATDFTLSWDCTDPENDPLTYDIYFGESSPPVLVISGQPGSTYDPGLLNYSTTYYWKIIAHDDHSNFTEGPIWSFTTIANLPPYSPTNPSPFDEALDISINSTLSWECTDPESDPLSYDVYFGESSPPDLVISGQTVSNYDPGILNYNTTYYWKIIAHDDHSNFTEGSIWSFTTITNLPPYSPTNPSPVDEALDISINSTLSWECTDPESDPLSYDVYFGESSPPVLVISGEPGINYDPGILDYSTTYFWKIVAHDDHYNQTVGEEWSFITEYEPCPGLPTIIYGGQIYNTLQIGSQCWLKENLNIGTRIDGNLNQTNNGLIEKYCYGDYPSSCADYGGLYQWDEMMSYSSSPGVKGICPDGWHLPTNPEWTVLFNFIGGASVAGGKMKEAGTDHWDPPNTGATNSSGFTALPGGLINNGTFGNLGLTAGFWTSSESFGVSYFNELSALSTNVATGLTIQSNGYSVRCIKN